MADAILYSSMDPDGPGPRLGMIDSTVNGVVGMYNLLMACLVNGYGAGMSAKPGHGWELAYAQLPNGFTLKSPDGVYYCFCRGSAQTYSYSAPFQVYMAEGVSDVTTLPPQGTNVRSGDWTPGSGEVNRQWISPNVAHSHNQQSTWFLIARGAQVLFSWVNVDIDSTSGSSPSGAHVNRTSGGMLYFGNAVLKGENRPSSGPQNSIVLGGLLNQGMSQALDTWNPTYDAASSYLGGGCMTLRDLISGAVLAGRVPTLYGRPNVMSEKTTYKTRLDSYPPDLMLERVPLWLGGAIGYMPGQFYSTYYSHALLSEVFPLFGKSPNYGECLDPIEVAGEQYFAIPTGYGCIFVSLLEKYWNA